MLVLTRKLQEQIKIGDQVTVTILKIKGGTVRVGIHAPRDVRVVRGELPRKDEVAAEVACETALVAAETVAAVDAMPIASDGPPAETVISFRIRATPRKHRFRTPRQRPRSRLRTSRRATSRRAIFQRLAPAAAADS